MRRSDERLTRGTAESRMSVSNNAFSQNVSKPKRQKAHYFYSLTYFQRCACSLYSVTRECEPWRDLRLIKMSDLKNPVPVMRSVKNEPIVMDLDEDVLCDEVNDCRIDAEDMDTSRDSGEPNRSNMQLSLCTHDNDDDDLDTNIDHQYMKLLDSFREDGDSFLSDNPLRSIRYDVDNGGYDLREFKAAREDRNTTRVTKKNVESKPRVNASTEKSTEEAELRRRRNSQRNVEAGKKENSEGQMVLDETYRSYLTWLMENSRSSRTDPEKEVQVKCEEYTMSSSDSDIIVVEDHPFLDEEDSPFVASKNYEAIDVDEDSGGDQRPSWFRKEIMEVLKQPYTEEEYKELNQEASVRRLLTRCRELRDGREITYQTDQVRPSYLDRYPGFKKKLEESLRENDRHRALNLLRGFIFYLTKLARDDAFLPWLDPECLKIRCFPQESSSSSSAVKLEVEQEEY
ncbi:hypothetical protein AALP_AA1G235000 [Arabis alpina]|uniref:Uncharacterized protein n=1 Tax=Arabis alpina TaxID=50452 RepID=A0A087HQ55_ARAAL|nr:hypothetical protein AALP_AA1G235000 [Arabis alpina]